MALDQAAQYIVDLLTGVFPDLGGKVLDAAEGRAIIAATPKSSIPVEDVASVVDREVPGMTGAPDVPVRVYRPTTDQDAVTPVVMFFHGGGFVICSIETHDAFCRSMANETGATVVSVEYRLAPETRFPGGVEDCYAATSWVARNAAELGVDASKLAVAGDSAGGDLAAVVAMMARDARRRGEQSPDIAFQLLAYPVTNRDFTTPSYTENAEGFFLTRRAMEWFWEQYIGPDGDSDSPYASPLKAKDLSDLPPGYVVTAEHDPLRDEGEAYAARLAEAGVAVEQIRYDGMFHGFITLPHPTSAEARAGAFEALRKTFS
jgi:acetyl esterase